MDWYIIMYYTHIIGNVLMLLVLLKPRFETGRIWYRINRDLVELLKLIIVEAGRQIHGNFDPISDFVRW